MSQNLEAGDFLVFQLESGYAILRVLDVENNGEDRIWHVAAYDEFFLDVANAEEYLTTNTPSSSVPHIALTNKAFESTQTARLLNRPLTVAETDPLNNWRDLPDREVSDRSVRLMLGLR